MTFTRRDVWTLSQNQQNQNWPDPLLWYAKAVRAMQAKPISDPTSWRYQAAIHGLANTPPPPGAPWNECQHATWYFLPWHRMYLLQFENIVRAAVVAQGGPADWALPYWNYEGAGTANQIPLAFRQATLPDGSPNPLLVAARRPGINTGLGLPANVTSSQAAMNGTAYTTPTSGVPVGFGGPQTGFAHFGPAPGLLENQPHNIVHVAVGGNGGLMSNPDTAAQDPIFWLHHANVDRIWESWRIKTNANATTSTWLRRTFGLRDPSGATIKMAVRDVLTTQSLGYTYDNLPADRGRRRSEDTVPPRTRPRTIGQSQKSLRVGRAGASTVVRIGDLPRDRSTGDQREARRFYLKLDDIEGRANPGVVYGVYVNLPDGADAATRDAHRVGTVSFFGIEHSTARGSDSPQTLSYAFDATEVVERQRAAGQGAQVHVSLVPDEGLDAGASDAAGAPDAPAAAPARTPTVTIGSVAIVTA